MAFAPTDRARLLLFPPEGGLLTTRQASLDAADRLVAPPEGLLTLGFDPTRFQTEPPACYRASWQLPGRDSHPLATTSLCWITIYISTSNSGRTRPNRASLQPSPVATLTGIPVAPGALRAAVGIIGGRTETPSARGARAVVTLVLHLEKGSGHV
jgi:hypothetical protein